MKKVTLGLFSALFLSFIIAAQPASAQRVSETPLQGVDRPLLISPQAILLDETKALGVVEVTIHADISFSYIRNLEATVELEGIQAESTFADDRGDLVAKFDWALVAGLFEGEEGESEFFTLTLTCTADGKEIFSGEDEVRVVF